MTTSRSFIRIATCYIPRITARVAISLHYIKRKYHTTWETFERTNPASLVKYVCSKPLRITLRVGSHIVRAFSISALRLQWVEEGERREFESKFEMRIKGHKKKKQIYGEVEIHVKKEYRQFVTDVPRSSCFTRQCQLRKAPSFIERVRSLSCFVKLHLLKIFNAFYASEKHRCFGENKFQCSLCLFQ